MEHDVCLKTGLFHSAWCRGAQRFFLTKGHKHYCGFLPEVGLKITVPGLHKGLNKTVMFIVYTHTHTHTHKQTESNPVITIPVYTTPRL